MRDYIKFGIGFFIGYELAKSINDRLADVVPVIVKRFKEGSC